MLRGKRRKRRRRKTRRKGRRKYSPRAENAPSSLNKSTAKYFCYTNSDLIHCSDKIERKY